MISSLSIKIVRFFLFLIAAYLPIAYLGQLRKDPILFVIIISLLFLAEFVGLQLKQTVPFSKSKWALITAVTWIGYGYLEYDIYVIQNVNIPIHEWIFFPVMIFLNMRSFTVLLDVIQERSR